MKRKLHIFIGAVFVSLALIYFSTVPGIGLIGRVLLLFSTLAHEMGHGLTAMLLGEQFASLAINWDGSGVTAHTGGTSRLVDGLISAGGLVGPSLAAALLFWAARGNDTRLKTVTRILGLSLVVLGVLTARSFWALLFTVGLGPVLLVATSKLSRLKLESLVVFIGVQLGLSVFTRADYLFTETARGVGMPSDVAKMAENLFLPYWFWGLVCGGLSVLVLFWGLRCYTLETPTTKS